MSIEQVYTSKVKCCGCGTCMNICPKGAITMEYGEDGYRYPVINKEKCIGCGLCQKKCQYNDTSFKPTTMADKEMDIYATQGNKEATVRSTSGGMFYLLAKSILSQNGIVYGAAYDENMVVRHIKAETMDEMEPIRCSKYVQSDVGYTYKDVKKHLEEGRNVLYSGTPCQLAGLYAYLGKDYDNLLSVGLICYGSTPPKMFEEYVKILEEKHGSPVTFFDFRDKTDGWGNKFVRIEFEDRDKTYIVPTNDDPYRRMFSSKHFTRASCNQCPYAYMKRYTDISIGDYWKIEDTDCKINPYDGLSKVFVSTEKGRKAFEMIKSEMQWELMPYDTAVRPNLSGKGGMSPIFDECQKDYAEHGFKYVMKKYIDADL
ncbi:MAG: Coenzyme F420 hydrogenase/dehydrogenase, beta subunit C-terminal domain [Clostridia bacterium]|nr:Coenzyme F420 hydrogenase/dehydrogenase, beta subunit C-terminal domain [Clostridia bacterium]